MPYTLKEFQKLDNIFEMDETSVRKELQELFPKLQKISFVNPDGSKFTADSVDKYMTMPVSVMNSVSCPINPPGNVESTIYRSRFLLLLCYGAGDIHKQFPEVSSTRLSKASITLLVVSVVLLSIYFGVFLYFINTEIKLVEICALFSILLLVLTLILEAVLVSKSKSDITSYNNWRLVLKDKYVKYYRQDTETRYFYLSMILGTLLIIVSTSLMLVAFVLSLMYFKQNINPLHDNSHYYYRSYPSNPHSSINIHI